MIKNIIFAPRNCLTKRTVIIPDNENQFFSDKVSVFIQIKIIMNFNKLLPAIAGSLLFLFSACGGRQAEFQQEAQTFPLLTIVKKSHSIDNQYPASIKGRQDIRIIPRVDGYLQAIHVKEGDKVKKGQLLFEIDNATYLAAVKTAKANISQMEAALAKARQEYESKQLLRAKNIVADYDLTVAKNDLLAAEANLTAARASLESAQNNLSFTTLRAPSDGVIGRIPYRKGDYVGPSTADGLTVVADNREMYVYFSMTERKVMEYLARYGSMEEALRQLPEVQLRLANGTTYATAGRVESISGIVDGQTGAVSARAVFDNAGGLLLSGGTGVVVMPALTAEAIVIPQEATFEIQDKIFVYRVVDGAAVATIVQVDNQHNGKEYVVTDGLQPGDIIIAKGAGFVQEGTRVNTGKE